MKKENRLFLLAGFLLLLLTQFNCSGPVQKPHPTIPLPAILNQAYAKDSLRIQVCYAPGEMEQLVSLAGTPADLVHITPIHSEADFRDTVRLHAPLKRMVITPTYLTGGKLRLSIVINHIGWDQQQTTTSIPMVYDSREIECAFNKEKDEWEYLRTIDVYVSTSDE